MGNKVWSILFGVVMLGCTISYAISPWMGWSLPEGVSSHAGHVDFLYYVILGFTTFFFLLTEGILVYFMWAYSQNETGKRPVSDKAEYAGFLKPLTNLLHSQHHVEMAWTFVPAAILIYIAVAQVNTWAEIKYVSANKIAKDADGRSATRTQIAVSARQFEWRMRYPSSARFKKWMDEKWMAVPANKKDYDEFATKPHSDDIHVVNELHIWNKHPVVVYLSTRDVIHSFNLPHFRVKQDALPGRQIPVWFVPIKANCKWDKNNLLFGVDSEGKENHDYNWDIPCAELCGWGHYRMVGRVYVHEKKEGFEKWLEWTEARNRPVPLSDQLLNAGRQDSARAHVKGPLTNAVLTFAVRHGGVYPDSLQQLLQPDEQGKPAILESTDALRDPWGGTYQYDKAGPKNEGRKPDIWAVSPTDGALYGNWPVKKKGSTPNK